MKSKKSNAKTLTARNMKKVKGRGLRTAASMSGTASGVTGVQGQLPPTSIR
ncbi:MAG TPA: hypothetical protein VMH37_03965 [Candidatus Binataceae bacterium]|nr:hypothetical protein [Candidatus Binataceae bacterium]